MNISIIKGRLTADPELRQTGSNINVCNFSVAVNRRFQKDGEQQADFFRCTAWRSTADFVSKYFKKGQEIMVRGEMQSSKYEKDGVTVTDWTLQVEEVEFCGSKGESSDAPAPAVKKASAAKKPAPAASSSDEEDLPF